MVYGHVGYHTVTKTNESKHIPIWKELTNIILSKARCRIIHTVQFHVCKVQSWAKFINGIRSRKRVTLVEVKSERRYGGGGGHWGAGYVLFLDLSSASKDVCSL